MQRLEVSGAVGLIYRSLGVKGLFNTTPPYYRNYLDITLTYLNTDLLTHSMQHSRSWEANRFSASQEIPHILWNPKIHYLIHKSLQYVPILNQLDTVHAPTSHLVKIHLNIILPSPPGSPKWSLPSGFPHQKTCIRLSSPLHGLHAPPILFFSSLSPEQYCVKSTDDKAPHYVVFSIPLLPRPY